jgi:hypothetical protein
MDRLDGGRKGSKDNPADIQFWHNISWARHDRKSYSVATSPPLRLSRLALSMYSTLKYSRQTARLDISIVLLTG